MTVNPTTKKQIDRMTVNRMICMMRKLPINSKIFLGETGKYFSKVLNDKLREKCEE